MNRIHWEHGFKRLTAVFSFVGLISATLLIIHIIVDDYEELSEIEPPMYIVFLCMVLIGAVAPWLLYFFLRFIIRGFLSSGPEK